MNMEIEQNSRTLNVKEFLRILQTRKWTIFLLFVSITGTTAVLTHLQPKVYRSQAKMLLNWDNSNVIVLAPGSSYSGRRNSPEMLSSEVELLKSHEVAERAFRLANEKSRFAPLTAADSSAIQRIAYAVEVSLAKSASVITVSYDDVQPVRATKMVNTVITAYHAIRTEIYKGPDDSVFLNTQLDLHKAKLESLRQTLNSYRNSEQIVSLEEQKNQTLGQLSKVEADLIDVTRSRTREETLLQQFHQLRDESEKLGGLPVASGTGDWSNASKLYQRLTDLRMERAQLLEQYTEEFDRVKAVNEEITTIKGMLDREVDRLLKVEESSLKALQAEEQVLQDKAETLRSALKQLPGVEQHYDGLTRDIQEYEKIYATLLQKREENRLSTAQSADALSIKIIDPALVPSRPIRPNMQFNVTLAAVFSLLVGFGLAFFLEHADVTAKSPTEIERLVGLPVLANIRDLRRIEVYGPSRAAPNQPQRRDGRG